MQSSRSKPLNFARCNSKFGRTQWAVGDNTHSLTKINVSGVLNVVGNKTWTNRRRTSTSQLCVLGKRRIYKARDICRFCKPLSFSTFQKVVMIKANQKRRRTLLPLPRGGVAQGRRHACLKNSLRLEEANARRNHLNFRIRIGFALRAGRLVVLMVCDPFVDGRPAGSKPRRDEFSIFTSDFCPVCACQIDGSDSTSNCDSTVLFRFVVVVAPFSVVLEDGFPLLVFCNVD